MRDGVFRRSNEFLFKDKRLKNAQPNLEDGSGDMRRAPSKNPKLHKIRQRKDREKRKKLGILNDQNEEEDEDEQDDTLMGKMIKQFNKKSSIVNENSETAGLEPNSQGGSSVSPERRKTIHIALNDIVQARLVKSRSVFEAPRQSIVKPHWMSESDVLNDPDAALSKKFNDTLHEQQALINFHKK